MKPIRIRAAGPPEVSLLPSHPASDLRRDFRFDVPLFSPSSAWNQRADLAPSLPESDRQIEELYRMLLGDATWARPHPPLAVRAYPFPFVNFDDRSVPIHRAGPGATEVRLRTYRGAPVGANPKIAVDRGRTVIPAPAGPVRPSGPDAADAEGDLVVVDQPARMEWDFRQVTTAIDRDSGGSRGAGRTGASLIAAGAIDRFYLGGSGTNPPAFYGARAAGTPLLAGLLLPEDVEHGSIEHALAFAIPALRNLNRDNPSEPFPSDVVYPASTTEREFVSASAWAIAAGQRMRLREVILGEDAIEIDDEFFAPVTRMFLAALRRYGAYAVDTAPSLTFFAEDVHTARIELGASRLNFLIGRPPLAPVPPPALHWRVLMERLSEDLEIVPFAAGRWWEYGPGMRDPHSAQAAEANFEMVAPPRPGLLRRRRG